MLPNGILAPCRTCWQCRQNRVNDWVGRNLGEATTATVSYAVTFTYGRAWDGRADHLRSVLLTYHDIQKMLMRMRKAGMVVRYIICGEYGTEQGRAHWHGVFHFYGQVLPDWEGEHLTWTQEKWDRVGGIHIPEWVHYDGEGHEKPLGYVHIKKATYAHVKYALKYLLKDVGDDKSQWKLAMSKAPALGHYYITQLARETVAAGLVPQDLKYSFPVRRMDGTEERQTFMLRRKLAETYLQTVIDEWKEQWPGRPRPPSEAVDTYEEFGRLGKEENLTQAWVEKLPGKDSIFAADGEFRPEFQVRLDAPRDMGQPLKRSEIRTRLDWLGQHLEESAANGERTGRQDQEWYRDHLWRQLEADAQQACSLTDAEREGLHPKEYRYWLNHPTRFKSVYGAALRQRLGNAGGAQG